MTRTVIDVDDELVAEAMRRLGVRTKREAVDLALRRVAGPPLTKPDIDAVRGIGFDLDLDDLRGELRW
jgi:Arc/MetJ family transcription regulator